MRNFLFDKDFVEWKTRSRAGLVWHFTTILPKGEGLNQKLKSENVQIGIRVDRSLCPPLGYAYVLHQKICLSLVILWLLICPAQNAIISRRNTFVCVSAYFGGPYIRGVCLDPSTTKIVCHWPFCVYLYVMHKMQLFSGVRLSYVFRRILEVYLLGRLAGFQTNQNVCYYSFNG